MSSFPLWLVAAAAAFSFLTLSQTSAQDQEQDVTGTATSPSTRSTLICDNSNQLDDLDDQQCRVLKVLQMSQVEPLSHVDRDRWASTCACQLAALSWLPPANSPRGGDATAANTWRVASMVANLLQRDLYNSTQPPYLWSDIDTIIHGVSIHTATRDYFHKRAHNQTAAAFSERQFRSDPVLKAIRALCWLVAADKRHQYRYLENLQRMSPVVFFKLLDYQPEINATYQASKSCKLLLLHDFDHFQLQANSSGGQIFAAIEELSLDEQLASMRATADKEAAESSQQQKQQQLESKATAKLFEGQSIDLVLGRVESLWLLNCRSWQARALKSLRALELECPMMVGDELPLNWTLGHSSLVERSRKAIKCGCQLLMHNATWQPYVDDPNVRLMAAALTAHFNLNQFPEFDQLPLWAFHGWYENIVRRLAANKKATVRMLANFLSSQGHELQYASNQQDHAHSKMLTKKRQWIKEQQSNDKQNNANDPTEPIGAQYELEALEVLRRGCIFIMFNHSKDTKVVTDIKLVQYLDNLQFLSQDPMFVFHLTLQDSKLFKLHALAQICRPIVK